MIAANVLIENLPALVEAAARGLAGANLTVLNGTQGVNEVVAGLVGQGITILDLLKKSTLAAAAPAPSANGTAPGRARQDRCNRLPGAAARARARLLGQRSAHVVARGPRITRRKHANRPPFYRCRIAQSLLRGSVPCM